MTYKEQIKHLGLKINWVAKRIGISNVVLSYYLNGKRDMPKDIETKLKHLLK